ncbi:hypothetical protein PIB30_050855 [Stylosanthes scabra]|uniref:Uncharacterized protein n=1 Tax=Stylosanthes scabra TaxID=79078 RepID=A0ABU6ZGH4_9FABA|nr:hypothetical protein [Stylosanthes scabra]
MLAFDYGKNQLIDDVLDFTGTSASLGKGYLSDIHHVFSNTSDSSLVGIVTAPILFAMEEFPQLRAVVDKGFDNLTMLILLLSTLQRAVVYKRQRSWP